MLLLLKKSKWVVTLFFLLMIHLVSWASWYSAELKIINKTRNYYVQAIDIQVFSSDGSFEKFNSSSIPPGGKEDMSWFNKWLSWESSTLEKKRRYSALKLSVSQKIGHGQIISIMLNQPKAKIENIPIEIKSTECHTTSRSGTEIIKFCDYIIIVGTGSE